MGHHAKLATAAEMTENEISLHFAEGWLTSAATEILDERDPQAAAECEQHAREFGCTDEMYGQYVILLHVELMLAGRSQEAMALLEREDAPYLRTQRGMVELHTALGRAMREAGNPKTALSIHMEAENALRVNGNVDPTHPAVVRHMKQLVRATVALL